jgi:hypothetical protein
LYIKIFYDLIVILMGQGARRRKKWVANKRKEGYTNGEIRRHCYRDDAFIPTNPPSSTTQIESNRYPIQMDQIEYNIRSSVNS